MELEKKIIKTIANDGFVLHFQPQVELKTNRVTGAEALIRMYDSNGGLIMPGEFIPIAEKDGYIISLIGEWVIEHLPGYVFRIVKEIKEPIRFSFNISAREFESEDFLRVFKKLLINKNLTNTLFGVEITESGFMKDFTYVNTMINLIKSAKFDVILDDFGTGFSSLKYLKDFSIDQLKIDKSFTDDLPSNEKTAIIVKNLVNLCKELKVKVIAEGVEKRDQLDFYREIEVDEIQGFYFSKPLATEEFIDYVKKLNKTTEEELKLYNFIKWEDTLSVEDDLIDIQHMIIINIINRFYNALIEKTLNYDMASKLFTESMDFFKMHFEYEEEILRRAKYPHLDAHREQHKLLLEKFLELKERMKKEKIAIAKDFFYLLKDYYTKHILLEDKKYSEYLKKTSSMNSP